MTIRIFSLMGGSTIRVPHGVHIDHSSFSIMGGDDIEAAEEGTAPEAGAPVVRIRSTNIMGGTTVQRGPRKPRRWQGRKRNELPPPEGTAARTTA